MRISYNWLHKYLPLQLGVEELSKILTDIGLEVEHIESMAMQIPYLKDVVVGHVMDLIKHENADKLRVATIDIGEVKPLTIVCGAPNIDKNQKVIVAKVGSQLKTITGNIIEIKKAKIRGQESFGMICSESELGLANNHEGIAILPKDAPIGTSIVDFLELKNADSIYEIGMTPNRTDSMSHIGVARNVCAYLSYHRNGEFKVNIPDTPIQISENVNLGLQIKIEKPEACKRYMGLILTDVKVKESPKWIKESLKSIGVKSINNVVDVTNFVLHEMGQPLHAFDFDNIEGHTILIKTLATDTTFTTLDQVNRKLQDQDLMICDEQKPLCIAGVYGGQNSGVTEKTKNIFLESAYFDPIFIRKTALKHNLRTDAATRFEKGVDISMVEKALNRAANLLLILTEAKSVTGYVDNYPEKINPIKIQFSLFQINRLIGKKYSFNQIETILKGLDFEIETNNQENITATVPPAFKDVTNYADIAEEILRIDGLNNVPSSEAFTIYPSKSSDFVIQKTTLKIQENLASLGFKEIFTNSISNSKFYQNEYDGKMVKMLNSLSSELDVMRPAMMHSGLQSIAHNINRQNLNLSFFELGKTYQLDNNGSYIENQKLSIWISGTWQKENWKHKNRAIDIYTLKGIALQILHKLGITILEFSSHSENYMNQCLSLKSEQNNLGFLGSICSKIASSMDVKQSVWYMEFDLQSLLKQLKNSTSYTPINKFPLVQRDLAIVIDKAISYQKIEQVLNKSKISFLKSFELFDVFESEKIGLEKKSMAMTFVFENTQQTLRDEEINEGMEKIVHIFETELEGSIRS